MMPLGRLGVRSAVDEALSGLGVQHLDIVASLAWRHLFWEAHAGEAIASLYRTTSSGSVSWQRCRTESYAALLEERDAGRIRAVGVSNFAPAHLDALQKEGYPPPAVHQLEMHPFWHDNELLKRHAADGTR